MCCLVRAQPQRRQRQQGDANQGQQAEVERPQGLRDVRVHEQMRPDMADHALLATTKCGAAARPGQGCQRSVLVEEHGGKALVTSV